MKTTFNGTCEKCHEFKPKCARVHWVNFSRREFGGGVYEERVAIVCADCRRENKNRFCLAEQHR